MSYPSFAEGGIAIDNGANVCHRAAISCLKELKRLLLTKFYSWTIVILRNPHTGSPMSMKS